MTSVEFSGLSLVGRPDLFAEILSLSTQGCEPVTRCSFGGLRGWLVADIHLARQLLTSSGGLKARPARSQRMLGGVGALAEADVRQVKRHLIAALGLAARNRRQVEAHLNGAFARICGEPSLAELTEAFSGAMLTHLTGQEPGAIDGPCLRALVVESWQRLEASSGTTPQDALGVHDSLDAFILGLVADSRSPSLNFLRRQDWTDASISEEIRAMVLAGWGSTTAATVSALSLRILELDSRSALDEVLRLYPPSFMIARTMTDRRVQPFEAGDLVVISPWLIHRNPLGWERPDAFELDRWRDRSRQRWFLPFGIGPRRCPAALLAREHAAVGVRELSKRFPNSPAELSMVEGRSPALVPLKLVTTASES